MYPVRCCLQNNGERAKTSMKFAVPSTGSGQHKASSSVGEAAGASSVLLPAQQQAATKQKNGWSASELT